MDLPVHREEDDGDVTSRESGGVDQRAVRRREQVLDWALVIAFAALSGLLISSVVDGSGQRAVAAVVSFLHVAPLARRRHRPALVLVAMGATAAKALLGPGFKVSVERGRWVDSPLAPKVLATVHPSSILRGRPEDRATATAALVADLRVVADALPARG